MTAAPELPAVYELVHLPKADDARSEAVRRARAGAPEGTLVWVDAPQAPRARLGRRWLQPPDGALHAALVLRPELPAATCGELAVAAVLAIARAVADVVEPVTELHYRWPNDLLLNTGKAAGVWLDAAGEPERIDWLVLGWAVNTGQPPPELGFEAAGIAREGRTEAADMGALLQAISRHLVAWIDRWNDDGFAPLRESWHGRLRLDEPIRLVPPDGAAIEGTAEAIDDDGALTVRTDGGPRRLALEQFFGLPGGAS